MSAKKVKMQVFRGNNLLFEGVLEAKNTSDRNYYSTFNDEPTKFLQDIFNIERYINAQGAYRCHMSEIPEVKLGE